MSQVSRYRLSEDRLKEIERVFIETIGMLADNQVTNEFLTDFLTPTEKIVLSKRIMIALMLKNKMDYETIKKTLKVSQSTIANVNIKLKYSGVGYHQVLDKLLKRKKIVKVFSQIERVALSVLSAGQGKGTSVWKSAKKNHDKKSSII